MINKEYFTKDLGEAAALLTAGTGAIRLQKDGTFFWFVFPEEECREVSNKYWTGELMLPAKLYSMNIRLLKDRLFAQR